MWPEECTVVRNLIPFSLDLLLKILTFAFIYCSIAYLAERYCYDLFEDQWSDTEGLKFFLWLTNQKEIDEHSEHI